MRWNPLLCYKLIFFMERRQSWVLEKALCFGFWEFRCRLSYFSRSSGITKRLAK